MHQQYLKQPKAAFKEVDFTEDIYSNFMMCKCNMVELIVDVLLFGSGLLGEAHELMVEALNLFHQVYGPLHADIATCYRYNSYFSVVKSTATYFIWCKIGRDLKGIYCYITKACLIFKWKCCDSF